MMKYTVVSSKGVRSCGVSNKGVSGNARRHYVAPATEVVRSSGRPMLYTASPGVGPGWQPGDDIDAKKNDLNIEFRDMWEE